MIGRRFTESRAKRGRAMKIEGSVDALAVIIATGFGAGMVPFGPGTWGSAVGLAIAYGLLGFAGSDQLMAQNSFILAGLILAGIGIWAGTRAEKIFDKKDAGQVVIDEVCGQVITFVLVAPFLVWSSRFSGDWRWWLAAGFVLFRAFDIFKPYPIDRLQDLPGGLGVMVDDIVAGIYAAILLSLGLLLF